MAKFFEGGKAGIAQASESSKPSKQRTARQGANILKDATKKAVKKVTRQEAAKQAQKQYTTGKATRDSNIVKSVKKAFNGKPTQLQQNARGGSDSSSVANAGAFKFSYKGGQFSGTGTQARDTLNSIVPQPGDMKAYAEFAAKRDTTTDATTAHFYDKYALPHSDIGPDAHDLLIGRGQDWMTDNEALTDWILGDAAGGEGFTSEEQYNEAVARQKQYETYMSRYLRDVKAFNPEDGVVQTEKQFTEDAPLPPWIQPTSANIDTWEYYKTYSHDVVQSTADAYDKAWQDQQVMAKTPYKSAFSTSHEEGDIDSFLDIAVSSRSWKQLKNNTANYFRDYVINPIKAGHILTAGGNALWNMMDTMDIASRGVRAFTAGATVLGGRNTTFKGQNVYWTKLEGHTDEESQRAQKLFMDNGGYELLLKAHPGEATQADLSSDKASMTQDELIAKLNEAFAKEGTNWRTIYNDLDENFFKNRGMQDISQAVENVKKAYSDPSAAFNADTGSMASDIIVESVLDPGLVFGGVAKNISKNTVLSSAELAVRDGLTNVLENADDAKALMKDKRVKRAISAFISSNEGKNIIFKNSQNFGDDVNVLLHTLETDMPHLFGNASTPEGARLYKANKRAFADTVSAHLFSKNQNISTDIIKSTGWARDALETKTFKAAYYMDKAIDGIDSAIIKSSFAAPWGVVKGVKQGKRILLNDTAVGRYYYAKRLRKAAAASAVRDEVTKAVDVTKFPDLMAKYNGGQLDEESVRAGLKNIVHEYDKVSKSLPKVTKDFMDGKVTVEEAYKFVGDQISAITGGKYRDINQLVTQVESYDVRYAGDLSAAYDRLMRNFTTLENTIYKQSDAAVADFLTELNHAENIDDVRRLFRDNMDNKVIMDLRTQVVDKVPFELSVDEVDNIVADLRSGVFSDTPLDKKTMKKAVSAVSQSSDTIVRRTIKVNEFKSFIKHNYAYLLDPENKDAYIRKLAPLLETTAGSPNELSLDDALKCIESAKRSLLTSEHLRANEITTDTAGMIHSDPRMADLRKLKDTIRGLDVISLKDNEVVTIMHVDRMAMMQKFTQAPAIAKVYGADYDNIIASAVSILETKSLENVDLAADTFAKDVMRLQELKYGRDRTEILTKQLKSINTLSDNKLHTVLNGLGNNFGRAHGTLTDTLSTPGLLRRNLETTARTQGGTPKVGINGLTDMLKSINTNNPSKFIQPYLKEFEDPKKGVRLRAKYDRIVNASALDPNAYVKKQMLASLLMDPDIITEYNGKLAKGNTPIFFHINSSGLSTEINEITSISCIKWRHIDVSDTDPLTMEKILDAIPDEPILFKRGMSDAQIDGISENVLRKLDMKGLSSSQLHDTVRNLYRAADEEAMRSESDVIEEFCAFLQNETVVKKTGKNLGRSTDVGVPTLVVHDLDGFNLPFLNKRASELYGQSPDDSKTRGYLENFSRRIQDASDNTYSRLASKVGDESFTVDELNQIEELLQDYVRDINDFAGDNFDPFDFEEYGKVFERVLYESTSPVDDELAAVRKAIVQASSGGAVDMEAYKHAMQDIADFAKYPKQFAFLSNTGGDNEVAIALRAAGKDSVNVESRIYVKDVMSFFDIEDADTGQMKSDISSLQKMHNLSQYVIRNRDHNIASGAEAYLAPYKDQFDDVINTVRNIGKNYSAGSEYSYLANIKTPNTAVESYLLSQKLYDDYIRFWCFGDEASTFADRTSVVNSLKQRMDSFYNDTLAQTKEMKAATKDASKQEWDALKERNWEYKKDVKDTFKQLSSERWDEYRNYKIDKEYAQMLYGEAKANTEHLWDDYRVKKSQLDEYYKQLKAETDRVVFSWDASKKFRKQFPTEADIQNIDTNNLDYFERYADYRKAFDSIDWNSYKQAKKSLAKYREFLQSRQDDYFEEYLEQLTYMQNEYASNVMSSKYSKEFLEEVRKDTSDLYDMYKSEVKVHMDADYEQTLAASNKLWDIYLNNKSALWDFYNNNPDRIAATEEFFNELMSYFNDYRSRIFDEFTNKGTFEGFDSLLSKEYDDIFTLFEGEKRPEIFKSVAKSDYFKTVYSYKDGVMKEGIDMATKLSEANANLGSSIRQLDWIDRYYINSGINSRTDRLTGMLHMKAKVLYDMLDATDISRRESFQTFIREASNGYHLKLRQQALDSLRGVDGKFNRDLLLSELVYNDFNHLVFNSHAYTTAEMRELVSSVKEFQKAGADFLSYYEDRTTGNIFIYLNYNADITTDGTKRFLNGKPFERTVKHAVDFVDFDELKSVLDLDDIDEFRDIYEHLKSCWEDTRILSQGRINGTSGKTVSRRQAEEYLETLPSEMYDMLSPKGVLSSDTARDIIYDPGFVRNEDTDILLDFLDTLSRQADVAKEDAVLINEVFNSNSTLQFNELSKHFSDKELMDYFGNNPDYVVVTLTSNPNTRTGLQVERLKVDNLASLQVAKEAPNTTILPYDMYYEIADTMNRSTQDGYYRRLLSKYMLVYKAFALVKPGTWLRNYIDATTKAALDNGEDITNVFTLLPYQAKAARDIGTYSRILKADPALLTKSNWEMIQKAFKTDMTFEDFELLRGVMDADQFKSADRYFMNKTTVERGGIRSLNAEDAGLRGLSEKDINTAFKKYLSSETDLPLSQTDFLDIYLGRRTADTATMEQFEDMMRRLSVNMHNSEASGIFDKTINFMFKPFSAVESLARYSQIMYLKDMGLSQNQITKHIHMTQFYTAPSWGAFNKLETIMPFITFRYNNFMYWMRMMDENPRFFRYFEDVYGTIAEDSIENMIESGQSTDYEDDIFLQSGSIPLGDTGLNIKVGNSFLSAVNDFYGGPDSLIGKYGGLNPVLKEALRFSGYAFGLNSKEFFSDVDWDLSKDMDVETAIGLLPGGSIMNQAVSLARRFPGTFENSGPSMDTLFQVLSFAGVLGIRKDYSSGGKVDFDEWQLELEKQGKWYDANLGKIVSLADKNTYGANDPNATWEDVQAYMMVHFGKIWDSNAHKFVVPSELSAGNFDVNFDFENDPDAWEKLQKWMKNRYGKVYDYNQRKFVYEEDYISGGLNDPDIPWEQKSRLIYEKFGLRWDGNQNTYVDDNHYMAGGLNDTKNFNEVKSLRLALYGEVWDSEQHKFVKVQDSQIVTIGKFFKNEEYDEYFSRLAIPRLQNEVMKFHISRDGFLITEDGKYILTKDDTYNARVFEKFKYTFGGRRYSRGYSGWKNYSRWKTYNYSKKPYKGRTLPMHYYTGYGWNDIEGYYRLNYQFNYQYHNPDPAKKLNRLLSPRIQYPYGGGYNKFSFFMR